jgi:hypothetical protein
VGAASQLPAVSIPRLHPPLLTYPPAVCSTWGPWLPPPPHLHPACLLGLTLLPSITPYLLPPPPPPHPHHPTPAGAALELSTIAAPRLFLPLACTANLAKNLAAVAASSTRAPIYRTFALSNNLVRGVGRGVTGTGRGCGWRRADRGVGGDGPNIEQDDVTTVSILHQFSVVVCMFSNVDRYLVCA